MRSSNANKRSSLRRRRNNSFKSGVIDTGKELADIALEGERRAAHQCLQAARGGVGSLALATGVTVRMKMPFKGSGSKPFMTAW